MASWQKRFLDGGVGFGDLGKKCDEFVGKMSYIFKDKWKWPGCMCQHLLTLI